DDMPPRLAETLSGLSDGEEVVLVKNGLVVARLTASPQAPPAAAEGAEGDAGPDKAAMAEILEHFDAMIRDEF
ncbi:MAG: hypothetical protein ACRED8_10755, partial [Caulobacteraceae bacterium]